MSQPDESVISGRVVVIGIGNEYRRDDAAGLIVARRLAERRDPAFTVLEHNGDGAALMEAWQGIDVAIVIDVVSSGAKPGTTHRIDASRQSLTALAILQPEAFRSSTHAFSLVQAVELSRTLHQLPPHFIVHGIEGQNFEAGTGLSWEVAQAVPKVAERVFLEASSASTSASTPAVGDL
jgi:hydrogenase maturation protease